MKITFLSVRVMQVVQTGKKKFLSYLFQRYQKSQMHYANKRKIIQIIFWSYNFSENSNCFTRTKKCFA